MRWAIDTTPVSHMMALATDQHVKMSFAQFGEDIVLETLFHWKTDPGFYVDVGAHHPRRLSNTHLFYMRGWRGINIDADANLMQAFREERPNDINLTMALSDVEESKTLRLFSDPAVNTLSDAKAEEYSASWTVVSELMVESKRLATVFHEHLPEGQEIDFLSVDVEGLDLKVLSGNDWSLFRPRVIVVEVEALDLMSATDHPVVTYLSSRGYKLVAAIHISAFFVRID